MRRQITAAAAVFLLCASGILGAQAQQLTSPNYQWSGELVSFDAAGDTLTVKARLVDQEAGAELKKMKAGDRILVSWSGYDAYADAIRRVGPFTSTWKAERFVMPAELVSTETPNQYLTFKVRVPAASANAIKAVKPGEWVTVTASHTAARETDVIVSIRPYTASSTAATN